MRILQTIIAAAAMYAGPAAAWDATVMGPDVFGKTTVIAGESGIQGEILVVQCDSEELLELALVVPKQRFAEVDEFMAKMLIRVDDGEVLEFAAVHQGWNDNHSAFVAMAGRETKITMVKRIEGAISSVDVGISAYGKDTGFSFSASGSTAAMEKVRAGCKLDQPLVAEEEPGDSE